MSGKDSPDLWRMEWLGFAARYSSLSSEHNNPAFWRTRAEDCRQLALRLDDDPGKKVMLEIAQSYERITVMEEARLLRKGVDLIGAGLNLNPNAAKSARLAGAEAIEKKLAGR